MVGQSDILFLNEKLRLILAIIIANVIYAIFLGKEA